MGRKKPDGLSRRERQIMEVVYRLGCASAGDVQGQMDDPPSYSTVRTLLRILETKGHLKHEQDGPRYVYLPVVSPEKAKRSALRRLLTTFFGGSVEQAVATLLDVSSAEMTDDDFARLARLIDESRKGASQ
jgi:predicted transcriptional regulator